MPVNRQASSAAQFFFLMKWKREKDGKDLDRAPESDQRSGQIIPLPLNRPACSGQNAEQDDVVLPVEKITVQGEAQSEQAPYL